MSQKVSPFMGGLGRDITSKLEITDDASVTVGDGINGGNVAVGDNGVISAGAGSDLQIYHNGTDSYIDDAGAGDLYIRASDDLRLQVRNDTDSGWVSSVIANDGGETSLHYNGTKKIATTSGGIDVTGDVQGDGLVIDGTFDLGTL